MKEYDIFSRVLLRLFLGPEILVYHRSLCDKVQYLCLKLVKIEVKDEDLPTNNLTRREVDHSFFLFYSYMPTEIVCILLTFTGYV